MSGKDEWITVGSPNSNRMVDETILSRSARKNKRRKDRRKVRKRLQRLNSDESSSEGNTVGGGDEILERALRASQEIVRRESNSSEKYRVKERRLLKKLNGIAKLENREIGELTPEEEEKIRRKETLMEQLEEVQLRLEELMAREEDVCEALSMVDRVTFDSDFACPICRSPLETAVSVSPCRHVFCRACIEVALQRSVDRHHTIEKQIEAIRCPICRTNLYDVASGKVHAQPAKSVRRKMSKATGTCHCGAEMSLSRLRQHLRECGDRACRELFGERPKFGSERFRQPKLLDPRKRAEVRTQEYDEEAALQAALVESLKDAGILYGES